MAQAKFGGTLQFFVKWNEMKYLSPWYDFFVDVTRQNGQEKKQ